MKITFRTFVLFLLSTTLSSCASLFGGLKDSTTVKQGYPENARVYFNGEYQGSAPVSFKIPKSSRPDRSYIEIRAEGFNSQRVEVRRKVSVGFALWDLVGTLGVGLIFDFANGNIYKIRPNKIDYYLDASPNYNPSTNYDFLVGDTVYFSTPEYDGYQGEIKALFASNAIVSFKRPPNNQEIAEGQKEEVTELVRVAYPNIGIATRRERRLSIPVEASRDKGNFPLNVTTRKLPTINLESPEQPDYPEQETEPVKVEKKTKPIVEQNITTKETPAAIVPEKLNVEASIDSSKKKKFQLKLFGKKISPND